MEINYEKLQELVETKEKENKNAELLAKAKKLGIDEKEFTTGEVKKDEQEEQEEQEEHGKAKKKEVKEEKEDASKSISSKEIAKELAEIFKPAEKEEVKEKKYVNA